MIKVVFALVFGVFTAGCSVDGGAQSARIDRMRAEIGQFQSDPKIVNWLAEEAVRAGVRSFLPVPPQGVPVNGGRVHLQYGMTTSDKNIYINSNSAGARSIVNLTHEIAHAARFGGSCDGHNSRWLNKYLEIAARFEARFPGVSWSGTTPTLRVMRNKDRYNIGNGC